MAVPFIKTENGKSIFNGSGEMIYYIPEQYFDSRVAVTIGETIDTMGIFSYAIFDDKGKSSGIKQFYVPTVMSCKPSHVEKVSEFKLTATSEAAPYRLLHFKKGDEAICSTTVPMGVANTELFLNLLTGAKLPENIPYNVLQNYIMDNAKANGFSYGISPQFYGFLISELYRSKTDPDTPFRLSNYKNFLDYDKMGILEVPKHISPYVSITSRNADEAIAGAMLNKSNNYSPLEKVLMN